MNSEQFDSDVVVLSDEIVAQFLQQNPEFFIRNSHIVEQMRVPHPVRDSVSLVEWQMVRHRANIQKLENEITGLMEQASANELLFSRLISLYSDLIQQNSLKSLLNSLHNWAKSMGLAGVHIRLFADKWNLNPPSEFNYLSLPRSAFETFRIQKMANTEHYLGSLTGTEAKLLLPECISVGSVAVSLMGRYGDLGIIIFNSRNSQHYSAGMGTLLLEQISLMLPALLERWIERT